MITNGELHYCFNLSELKANEVKTNGELCK